MITVELTADLTNKELINFYKSQINICKEKIEKVTKNKIMPKGMKICVIQDLKLAIAQYTYLIELVKGEKNGKKNSKKQSPVQKDSNKNKKD